MNRIVISPAVPAQQLFTTNAGAAFYVTGENYKIQKSGGVYLFCFPAKLLLEITADNVMENIRC